ncbi:hypothetical protein PG997_014615 [Apiospora hydei]|uniref:Histone chaperone domain-containing protein n=1 Tax=Apiospora hydei TaxID=1337664 RepID=A0ABR1UUC5_9PEZI
MPKTDSTNLSERDIKIIAVFMKNLKEKHVKGRHQRHELDRSPQAVRLQQRKGRQGRICLHLPEAGQHREGHGLRLRLWRRRRPQRPRKAAPVRPGLKRKLPLKNTLIKKKQESSDSDGSDDGGIKKEPADGDSPDDGFSDVDEDDGDGDDEAVVLQSSKRARVEPDSEDSDDYV